MNSPSQNGDPQQSDLVILPVRACVAFAVRCALRAGLLLESLDEDTRNAARRAITVAEEYAEGKDCASERLRQINNAIQPPEPSGPGCAEEHARAAAYWAAASAWGAAVAPAYLSLGGRRTRDNGVAAATAARAAKAAIASKTQNRTGVWQDLILLHRAVEAGEITPETPVPQSFFSR